MNKALTDAKKLLKCTKFQNKLQYDKCSNSLKIKIGDKVLIKNLPYNYHKDLIVRE